MEDKILFKINYDKAIEVIVWLADKMPDIDCYRLISVLFCADKLHVNLYGRPVLGDTYLRLEEGLMPKGVCELIEKNLELSLELLQKISNAIYVKNTALPLIVARRPPNMDYLSGSDVECLTEALNEYAKKTLSYLEGLKRSERGWVQTGLNHAVDYALLVEDSNPHKREIIEDMTMEAPYLQF